jgi:hypothetical protein
MAQHQRIAVGRLRQDIGGADIAVGAGAVLDDNGLTQGSLDFLANDAGHDIGGAARTRRHDEADRMVGIGLCARR